MPERTRLRWWGNLLGYQATWCISVAAAGRGHAWPGVAAALAFAAWQLGVAKERARELRIVVLALLFGALIDGALAASAWLSYAAASPALPPGGAPLWILGLWLAFALTLNGSLAFLQQRWWFAAVFGAIGAPLAYLAAARGWQAVAFPSAAAAWTMLALAASWAIALPALAAVARRRS